jgi:TIGR03009 family protein
MRAHGLVLTALLLTGLPAGAQQAAPAPAASPDDAKLDNYLQRWENEVQKVETLTAVLNRTDKDKTLDSTTKLVGNAQYMRVGTGPTALNLARCEMALEGRRELAEKLVCTGTFLYVFRPGQKEIKSYELPKPKPGQVADDGFLSLLFGTKRTEARKRWDLKLLKEDQWYIYVLILPRTPQDRNEFKRARLVLNKDSFLPAQLWFETPNGNETTWDIPTINKNVTLERRLFDKPELPAGWKMVPGIPPSSAPAAPRVIRNNDR